jgi:aminopeptidase N
MKTTEPVQVFLKDYKPPAYLVETVALTIRLHPTRTHVSSRLRVKRNPAFTGRQKGMRLDGEKLDLLGVRIDRSELTPKQFTRDDSGLSIPTLPERPFDLEIETTCNPQDNTELSGLYLSRGIYCTQCEAEGFRRITYFPDRPDVLARYTTRIEADREEAPVLLGNGNPLERGTLDGGKRHYAVWKDPHPKPSYLFAIVGGQLAPFGSSFRTMSGREVDLRIYVEPGKEDRCAWAMDALKRSMKWDEERFGREYDLDVFNIVAVSDFNMGAMENKGLNIFNDRLILASQKTATDQNYADIERVVAHEYFHNWTGNRITCRDWFQLCLKEGLTVYRDQEFSADMRSRAVQRITEVRNLKARQFAEDAGPLAHPARPDRYAEINNFYTATVYDKGAEIVRMLATLLGERQFRQGMDLYFERHDGEAATVEQFLQCFADVSNRDLAQFMLWYEEAGTPTLECRFEHDAKAKVATLKVEQILPPTPGKPRKKVKDIPLKIGLVGPDGRDIPLKLAGKGIVADGLLEVRKRSETFRFEGVSQRVLPSLNRGFSAPVNVSVELAPDELAFLVANDSDTFNRWQAAQTLALDTMAAWARDIAAGRRPARADALVNALRRAGLDESLDPAFRAALLTLPGEADVARIMGRDVDPSAVHRARLALRKAVAAVFGEDLARLHARHEVKGRYAPDTAQSGARALRNAALGLMAARAREADLVALDRHHADATCATDEIASLAYLANTSGERRRLALERYQARWKDEPLMIDHWFTVQAVSAKAGSPAAIRRLTRDPGFSWKNPNKVRSLLFAFGSLNPLNFNRPDGSGYGVIIDAVEKLDALNPQMAARLLGVFRSWRLLEPERNAAAKAALTQLKGRGGLSRDVSEILGLMIDGA